MSDLLLRLRTIPNNFYEARLTMIIAAEHIEALEAALRLIITIYTDISDGLCGKVRDPRECADVARAALDKDAGK